MLKLKTLLLTLILSVSLLGLIQSNLAKETTQSNNQEVKTTKIESEMEEISNYRWIETLRLKDFLLTPNFLEIKEKIGNMQDVLKANYEENPTVLGAIIDYGFLLIDLGEIDKAKEVWDKSLEVIKLNQTPRVYKAWVDALKENFLIAKNIWHPVAKERLENAGKFVMWLPHHLDAVLGLYLIKDNLPEQDKLESENLVLEIARQFGANPKFGSILITKDLQAGKTKSARKKIKKILERSPDDTTTITLLGIAELIDGNYEEALKHFDNVNELNPSSPTNHLMRGRVLISLKNKKEGLAEIDQAIKLDPVWSKSKVNRKQFTNQRSYLISTKA